MGKQSLYNVAINVDVKGYGESDTWKHSFGLRKIDSYIDDSTGGRYGDFSYVFDVCFYTSIQALNFFLMLYAAYVFFHRLFKVNGEPIFIRGGNWILSDGLLRLSKNRYHTDIKFHADMNFNMIRCWGGGLAERPEFYHYCDYYGILVSLHPYSPSAAFFYVCCCLLNKHIALVLFWSHLVRLVFLWLALVRVVCVPFPLNTFCEDII